MNKNHVLLRIRSCVLLSVVLLVLPAALAAQGWYLMHPPVEEKTLRFNPQAPLRQWKQLSAHDNARECEVAKLNLLNEARNLLDDARKELASKDQVVLDSKSWIRYQAENLAAAMATRCIASDDPRLK